MNCILAALLFCHYQYKIIKSAKTEGDQYRYWMETTMKGPRKNTPQTTFPGHFNVLICQKIN